MINFSDFVSSQALKDKLPFGVDFEISPADASQSQVEIAGFYFPQFDELLSREAWFFEVLESLNSSRKGGLQLLIKTLARKLRVACDLPSLQVSVDYLFSPTPEISESESYQTFIDDNQSELDQVIELFNLAEEPRSVNWFRVTFFILSRIDSTWTLGKTASLRQSQIDQIIQFITKEANGGVEPEVIDEESEDPEAGKKSAKRSGARSTGV